MLQTIILGIALYLSLITVIHLIVDSMGAIANVINDHKWSINAAPALITGAAAIILWCLFYYLTH